MREQVHPTPETHRQNAGSSAGNGVLVGTLAVIVALLVAAAAYLVVSDDDDDGNVDVDVPAVDADLPDE